MIKTSVKKPFTVLVAVIMVIALGFVSLSNMTADLLPEFSLPYMIVITTYPGAGPEKVESMVSQPMESALGTISGVKNISSSSSDNYSMVQLEFEDETDMSAALVKVSNAIDTVRTYLPDEAGTPTIMEISMDMMASTYLGVSFDGKDQFELSSFVEDELVPYIERQDGVANVNSVGLVEKSVVIELDEEKVLDLNDRILGVANKGFADAYTQLKDAKQKLIDGQDEINDGWLELAKSKADLIDKKEEYEDNVKKLDDAIDEMDDMIDGIETAVDALPLLLENKTIIINGMKTAVDPATKNLTNTTVTQADAIINGLYQNASSGAFAMIPAGGPIDASKLVIKSTTKVADAKKNYAELKAIASATDLGPMSATLITTSDQMLRAIGGLDMIAEGAGIYTPASIKDTITFGQLKKKIDALPGQLESGLTEGIAAYNGLREGAGLETVTWTAATITKANVDQIENDWDGLWGSASAYSRSSLQNLEIQRKSLDSSKSQLDAAKSQLDSADDQIESAEKQLNDGQKQIDDGWDQYNDSVKKFNKQRAEVLKSANADELVSLKTLSSLIYAQNFEMPAGYIDDKDDNSWLIKVGQNFKTPDELENIVLTNIHDVGDVRLSDIASVITIDNLGEQYAKMNGKDAVLLAVFKASTASTNDVSEKVTKAMAELEEKYEGLKVTPLLDQGEYIDLLVGSVLESMILGAVLAIIILAIFLKDVIPTIVVAVSIPLSVLLAVVCMYFAGITLNMMTLAGLALGIGMLVDNSIVVIENIYRLRSLGYSPAKAAVVGAKEVAGPIISSTLTTICVFVPILFAKGLVKELILPMCLTVTFCLTASLLIALSVVPAAGSTLLKNSKAKEHPLFDKLMEKYAKTLSWCLKVKVVPLLVAIALLGVSIWQVVRMGIVMVPNMATEPIEMTVTIPDEMDKETAYKKVDDIVEKVLTVDGVDTVGAMPGSALISTVSGQSGSGDYHNFIIYIMIEGDNPSAKEIKAVTDQISSLVEGIDVETSLSSQSLDTSALLGSGLSINIYGNDLNKLMEISNDVMDIVAKVDGYVDISNAQEEGAGVVHLVIDKDAAMRCGLPVAQIYSDINTKLTEEVTSTTLTVNGQNMDVLIRNKYSIPNVENILDMEFKTKETDSDGDSVTVIHKLSDFATVVTEEGLASVERKNLARYITVSANVREGENATLLSRELKPLLAEYKAPAGYSIELGGESDTVDDMVVQMAKMMALGFLFIYLVMVAQFQSLLSPFIILFTIPLAFTGGLIALWLCGEQLSILSLMGFLILMGTVVNNGIVFVDYANQLRIGGMERREALIETGKTRMRPILMTALTTILAMFKMALGTDLSGQLGRGMALVIMGGLLYATLMTLYIVPVVYDILFKREPLVVDVEI